MKGRTKRPIIAVLLTIFGVAADNYFAAIWRAYARDRFAKATPLGLLGFWVASAVVLWFHVAYDLGQPLRERDPRLAFNAAMTPAELESDSNV
jgi:hypothetical protein